MLQNTAVDEGRNEQRPGQIQWAGEPAEEVIQAGPKDRDGARNLSSWRWVGGWSGLLG